ncbi:protein of unknown function [Lactiplantibacillus plantarum]
MVNLKPSLIDSHGITSTLREHYQLMIVFFDTIPTALPFKQTIHLSDHLGKKSRQTSQH